MMMNRPLKFDRSDFRAHYEDVAAHTLRSIGRHGARIALLARARDRHHTADAAQVFAEALIYPDLFSQKDEDSLPPCVILDPILERLVEREEPISAIVAAGFDRDVVAHIERLLHIAGIFGADQSTVLELDA
jgi:hypothetical protein